MPITAPSASSAQNRDGGTHVEGLQRGLTRVVNDVAIRKGLLKEGERLRGEHVRAGLNAIISGARHGLAPGHVCEYAMMTPMGFECVHQATNNVLCPAVRVREPEFQGQTKDRLTNTEVSRAVQQVLMDRLGETLDLRPAMLEVIVQQGQRAMRADEAAKRAREVVKVRVTARVTAHGTRVGRRGSPPPPPPHCSASLCWGPPQHCRASWPTASRRTPRRRRYSSWRATRRGAAPSRAVTAASRPSSL